MPGLCTTHGKWSIAGKKCPRCEMDRVNAENFPPDILDPWRHLVARKAPRWEASMFPLLGGTPFFRLKRSSKLTPSLNAHDVSYSEELLGESQEDLIAAACMLAEYDSEI